MDEQMKRLMEGWMGRWLDGSMDEKINGWIEIKAL